MSSSAQSSSTDAADATTALHELIQSHQPQVVELANPLDNIHLENIKGSSAQYQTIVDRQVNHLEVCRFLEAEGFQYDPTSPKGVWRYAKRLEPLEIPQNTDDDEFLSDDEESLDFLMETLFALSENADWLYEDVLELQMSEQAGNWSARDADRLQAYHTRCITLIGRLLAQANEMAALLGRNAGEDGCDPDNGTTRPAKAH